MIVKPEIVTQKRIIKMFEDPKVLGYENLGNFENRENNSNIERELLEKYLKDKYDSVLIKKAIDKLEEISIDQTKTLYEINKQVYRLLRYGVNVKLNPEEAPSTVWLIDWDNPKSNNFSIAEEVTIKAASEKRPDIVLYVNGIALVVLELKKSSVSVEEGIRQNIDNQKDIFIKKFFTTIQLVMAGSDSMGLRYGVINTPEKYYLSWKEDTSMEELLDNHLFAMCQKERLLDIIHNFIVYDDYIPAKKVCRHNQYFGAKKTQESLRKGEGGILWHTQGSGKSLLMIWLAKWIRENREDNPRVLILTDREELDSQIERFFDGVNEEIYRATSGQDVFKKLDDEEPWLMCSLIQKFREDNSGDDDYEKLLSKIPKNFAPKGNLYIFIDECHRTQNGKLHDAMIKKLPNAIILGFTGTPLLQKDKKTTEERFGKIIHSYKYDEAVEDKVVLDLLYWPREITQNLTSPEKIDQYFAATTQGMPDFGKQMLKKQWATMQKVVSSKDRLSQIVKDIIMDMKMFDRLVSGRGNAILVAGDIYQACRYYDLFQQSNFKKCAIITSYHGDINSIKGEAIGGDEETDKEFMFATYNKMLEEYDKRGIGNKDPQNFEKQVKELFVTKPGEMQLLIVVNKLLTGFDAPPATYIYIDKNMKDHGLFQAICRVNRLDGDDKVHGFIIDYRDLFKSLGKAMEEYTSDAFGGYEKKDVKGLLKNRIKEGKKILDERLEAMSSLCEPVKPPKKMTDYYKYFCGSTNQIDDIINLKESKEQRFMFYKITSQLVRAYAELANDMKEAGYNKDEVKSIKWKIKDYESTKKSIKWRSGESIDLKKFEPDMRHLIDNYIGAEESETGSVFEDVPLVDLIVKSGITSVINFFPPKSKETQQNFDDMVIANVRKVITAGKKELPHFHEKMSEKLDQIIEARNKEGAEYQKYLKNIEKLCKKLKSQFNNSEYPNKINTKPRMAFYDLLENNEELVIKIDTAIIENKEDEWKGNIMKERMLKTHIKNALEKEKIEDIDLLTEKIFELAQMQNEY